MISGLITLISIGNAETFLSNLSLVKCLSDAAVERLQAALKVYFWSCSFEAHVGPVSGVMRLQPLWLCHGLPDACIRIGCNTTELESCAEFASWKVFAVAINYGYLSDLIMPLYQSGSMTISSWNKGVYK
jgi:hypothetical protein